VLAGIGAGVGTAVFGIGQTAASGHDVTVSIDNVGFRAWEVTNVEGSEDVAETGVDNPRLTLTEGTRYKFENGGWSAHPLAFRDSSDDPLLSQDGPGTFEDDEDVNWVDNGDTLAFTVTSGLAAELDDYICTVHSSMNGSVAVNEDTEPAAAVSFITASHDTVGVNTADERVLVNSVRLDDGGFVAIHDSRLGEGQPVESVVGVSEYLSPGEYENIFVPLSESVDDGELLTAMPHRDTDGDETYDFVSSGGDEDAPYTEGGDPVTDTATAVLVDYENPPGDIAITTPDSGTDEDPPTVTPPFDVAVDTSEFVVEAASNGVTDGQGHLHALLNRQPVGTGEYLVFGTDNIIHYGTGAETVELTADELRPGEHTIRMQAGDANHVAYNLVAAQTVIVSGTIDHYTDDTDVVTVGGLLNAIDDWRSNKIGVELLLDVIDAWRSGDPVT
jgi:plastocyanin